MLLLLLPKCRLSEAFCEIKFLATIMSPRWGFAFKLYAFATATKMSLSEACLENFICAMINYQFDNHHSSFKLLFIFFPSSIGAAFW
jgi:hypothetical protein